MLVLHRKKKESITIGADIRITILEIGNDQVKVAIDAPRAVPIARSELLDAADANKEAASLTADFLKGNPQHLFKTFEEKKGSRGTS